MTQPAQTRKGPRCCDGEGLRNHTPTCDFAERVRENVMPDQPAQIGVPPDGLRAIAGEFVKWAESDKSPADYSIEQMLADFGRLTIEETLPEFLEESTIAEAGPEWWAMTIQSISARISDRLKTEAKK
jgi:hypothetical protein